MIFINPKQKSLHSKSKKITKEKTNSKPRAQIRQSQAASSFTPTIAKKQSIIFQLMMALNMENLSMEDLTNSLKNINISLFNGALREVLSRNIKHARELSWVQLKHWRRRLYSWINAAAAAAPATTTRGYKTPEIRGGTMIPIERLNEFKERLVPILQSLPNRSFGLIQRGVSLVFRQMRLKSKPCTKHFWFHFLSKHPDIRDVFSTIPIKRRLIDSNQNNQMKDTQIENMGGAESSKRMEVDDLSESFLKMSISIQEGRNNSNLFQPYTPEQELDGRFLKMSMN